MLTARFDPAAGELRLPAPAIEALGRVASPGAPQEPSREAAGGIGVLEELGVVEGGRVHPAVARVAAVIGAPLVRVAVRVGPPAAPFEARVWLDAGFAVCARPAGGGGGGGGGELHEMVVGPPSATPVVIAGLVDLGPRPRLGLVGGVVLPDLAVRALLGEVARGAPEDFVEAAGVPAVWRAPLVALAGHARRTWSASARWMVGEGRVARREVGVVDGGDEGLWRCQPVRVQDRRLARLRPVRSRDIWRELCALLPTGEKLAAAETDAA